MYRQRAGLCLALAVGFMCAQTQAAAPPEKAARGKYDPLRYYDAVTRSASQVRQPEIVEMLMAVLTGSDMGPGEGWFHGAQARYDWKWLATRYDANKDGKISRAEFKGPS